MLALFLIEVDAASLFNFGRNLKPVAILTETKSGKVMQKVSVCKADKSLTKIEFTRELADEIGRDRNVS